MTMRRGAFLQRRPTPNNQVSDMDKIKVLIIDDAAFMRKAVREILQSDPEIEVVGDAKNGMEGLEKIKALKPDVITLDIDMPVMDGLTAIRHIMIEAPLPVVVLSSLFSDGTVTFDALRLGVVDFVPKPSGAVSRDIDQARQQLIDRVKIARSVHLENIRRVRLEPWDAKADLQDRYGFRPLDYLLTVGTTLCGPNTVIRLISQLPPTLPAAVVVIQEISPRILSSFVRRFDDMVPWAVEVAEEDRVLEQGTCYVSPYKSGVSIQRNASGEPYLKLNGGGSDPLDRMFRSAADVFREKAIGVLLTGTGEDGADGFAAIREENGVTIALDTQCCVYPNLAHNAIAKGTVDIVLDESGLPDAIEKLVG